MNEYLNHFVTSRNTKASAAVGELALVIPGYRTNQFGRPFLPAAARLWNLLPSGGFCGDSLVSFKSDVTLCLQRA